MYLRCILVSLAVFQPSSAFLSIQPTERSCNIALRAEKDGGPFQGVKNFFAELDAFIDDASARRLGNGAAFYGKRKSNFYGENDKMRKSDRDTPDPTEDYQGPSGAGYFKWMPDENGKFTVQQKSSIKSKFSNSFRSIGRLTPVTRMKEKNIERNPQFWDKVFEKDED